MSDKKNKNDYSCTAFKDKEKVNFMRFVHYIPSYLKWLEKNDIDYDYVNVYWRRSGTFKERIYTNK